MPDAHHGYGMPTGGGLDTDNTVTPYAVGVDIGCRMALPVLDLPAKYLTLRTQELGKLLPVDTRFGSGRVWEQGQRLDYAVLADNALRVVPFLKNKLDRAAEKLVTSGLGNHLVEFGTVEITDPANDSGLSAGQYVGLLSHSGSRGLGISIANHSTTLAMGQCMLPIEAKPLAWLGLDTEVGQEYWAAMNLAGYYASACYDRIHRRLAKVLGTKPLVNVESHHNFAWREQLANSCVAVVHRKGATPAGAGVLGIIPGSMTAPGFIMRGRDAAALLAPSSHGAGRFMLRTRAKAELGEAEVRQHPAAHGVILHGGGLDKVPMACKNIH